MCKQEHDLRMAGVYNYRVANIDLFLQTRAVRLRRRWVC
jgi:hypothetical protein